MWHYSSTTSCQKGLKLQLFKYQLGPIVKERTVRLGMQLKPSYWTSSDGVVGLGLGSSGTGDVASMRAGLRMIGRDMGGTPTCKGEARGCRMRGDWPKGEAAWAGEVVNGTGMGGMEVGAGDDRPDPLALTGGGSRGEAGLLVVCASVEFTRLGEGGWMGGGDT